jgi:type I restriction enzyme S subunit
MSSRAPIGYLVINKVPMCTNQGFKSFQIKDKTKMNAEFLYYYLKSIVEQIKSGGSGTTFNEISKTKAENILISYPKSKEYEKIFSKLRKAKEEFKKKM